MPPPATPTQAATAATSNVTPIPNQDRGPEDGNDGAPPSPVTLAVVPMWLVPYNQHVFKDVPAETVCLLGLYCQPLVKKAFDAGVVMPPDEPLLGRIDGQCGPAVQYFDTLFGPDFWNLKFTGARKDILCGVNWAESTATELSLQQLMKGVFMRKIYEVYSAKKLKPRLLRKLAQGAAEPWNVAPCVQTITLCNIPSRTETMLGGELPWLIQDFLTARLVIAGDYTEVLKQVSGQPKLPFAELVQRTLAHAKARQEMAAAASARAAREIAEQAQRDSMSSGAARVESDDDMSLGASTASRASSAAMSLGEDSSRGSSLGGQGQKDPVELQDKLFGATQESRTSLRMLISQPERGRHWMGLELGFLDGDDFVLYEAASVATTGGRAVWQVRRKGTNEATKAWDAKMMAQALEAAEIENSTFAAARGQRSQPRTGMGDVAGLAGEQVDRLEIPSASEWTAADKALFKEMNESAGRAMMGGDDELVGDLGYSSMDQGKVVKLSWICEFMTETEFNRQLPAVARTLTILTDMLNRKWGNTKVTAFQAFLVIHLGFSRGAQQATNALSFAFSADDFVAAEGRTLKKSNPLSASKTIEEERLLTVSEDGQVSLGAKKKKAKPTSILALDCVPMHVLFFVERVAELLRCAYQAQVVDRLWGDVAERTRQTIQQDASDLEGVGQLLQCAFSSIGKSFRAHMKRPGYAMATFRHSLTQAQLQGVLAERTKDTLASIKAVREQSEKAMASMVQTQAELRKELKSLQSGKGGGKPKGDGKRKRDELPRDQQQQRQQTQQQQQQQQQQPGSGAGRGKGGGKGGGKGRGRGDGGSKAWPGWLLDDARAKCEAKFPGANYYQAMRQWFSGEDRTGMCFQLDGSGIGASECTNSSCKVCVG